MHALVALAVAGAAITGRVSVQEGVPPGGVPQTGVPWTGVPQTGVPQIGVPQVGTRFGGDPRSPAPVRRIDPRLYRPPVTVVVGPYGDDVVAWPSSVNLPDPAAGLVWRRIGGDAVLYDLAGGTIVEVRQHWFD